MRMSQYFLPTMKENPAEAQIVSHRLMLRSGLVRQTSAGIYAWLPLGLPRAAEHRARRARGAKKKDAAGAQEVLMPTIQSADLWRESGRYDAYGAEMLRIKDRHDREMLYGPTNEEMITMLFRDGVKSYRGPAEEPLSHPVEVPGRGPSAFRRHARPRVPDEGQLLVRHRQGGRGPLVQQDVRRLLAHLRPHGAEGDPDARRHRPDRGATSATSSSSWPRPAKAPCSATRGWSSKDILSRTIDYSSDLQGIVNEWTPLYAATDEKHDVKAFEELPGGRASGRARHRGRPYLLFRHQIPSQ